MQRLKPEKLHVMFSKGTAPDFLKVPRRYTLTHSDRTGNLFLTIGSEYDVKQISGLYTRLMRDEILAELSDSENGLRLSVYCHVSGGFIFGTAKFRYNIFLTELPLVLEAVRYGDRTLFECNPELDNTQVYAYFKSGNRRYNRIEYRGTINTYR